MYQRSKRLTDILEKSEYSDYDNLDNLKSNLTIAKCLAKLYLNDSYVMFENVDYENMYNIIYLLCIKDYTTPNIKLRTAIATQDRDYLKLNPNGFKNILQKYI